jgi:hypothetical protein
MVIAGHAFIQNLRCGQHDIELDASPSLRIRRGVYRTGSSRLIRYDSAQRRPSIDAATPIQQVVPEVLAALVGEGRLPLMIGIVVAAQGTLDMPVITWPLLLVRGFAFVPAAYYAASRRPESSASVTGPCWSTARYT